jgi:hypothetical protein
VPLTINGIMVAMCRIEFRRNDDGRERTACCTRSSGFDSFVWQESKPGHSKRSATDGGNRLIRNRWLVSMWMQEVNITRVRPCNRNAVDHSSRSFYGKDCFRSPNAGVVGSNPTRNIDFCVCVCVCVCVFILCLCYPVCTQRPYDQLISRPRSPTACG